MYEADCYPSSNECLAIVRKFISGFGVSPNLFSFSGSDELNFLFILMFSSRILHLMMSLNLGRRYVCEDQQLAISDFMF